MIRKLNRRKLEKSCNRGESKLARSLANEIYEICKIFELPGNLYNKIQKLDLNRKCSIEDKVWLLDFQSDNFHCPTELRKLTLKAFKVKGSKKNANNYGKS